MTWWMVLAGYLLGWVVAIRPAMRERMLEEVCARCKHREGCQCRGCCVYQKRAPRGALAERTGRDVANSMVLAFCWPVLLAAWLFMVAVTSTARGVTKVVVRAVPLTEPELERRLAEQQREIARLTAQIGGES